MESNPIRPRWIEKIPVLFKLTPTKEVYLFVLLIILAIISRFVGLGQRVISHDESLHVYFSYLLSQGEGYAHTPLTHGPLQFHLIALLFLLFGSSDFIARIPHALASILTIVLIWNWRSYLGRTGTILAALFLVISPYMLFYGRYARNESLVGLFGLLTLYSILRYLETGKSRYLTLLTIVTALHFAAKETAFIYTAQALLFLAGNFLLRIIKEPWKKERLYNWFLVLFSLGIVLLTVTGFLAYWSLAQNNTDATTTLPPIIPTTIFSTGASSDPGQGSTLAPWIGFLAGAGFLILIFAYILMIIGFGWNNIRQDRSYSMIILLLTFSLPQLSALPVKLLGWDPLDYQFIWPGWNLSAIFAQSPARTTFVLISLFAGSIILGLTWNKRNWWKFAVFFWGIYITLYTTFFTNPAGFATGTVGSLGYWLVQQGVQRGGQPWYYYLLVQIPLYEFLPALGLIPAFFFSLRKSSLAHLGQHSRDGISTNITAPFISLLTWWCGSSLIVYSIAGEKMPWLTVHISLPMIILSAWGVGQIIEKINWTGFLSSRKIWYVLLSIIAIGSLSILIAMLLGQNPPFQGKTTAQLVSNGEFLFLLGSATISIALLVFASRHYRTLDPLRISSLAFYALLVVLTVRTAYRSSFVDYDHANEYLVYAHGSRGIKDIIEQIQVISQRTTGGYNDLVIAYDAGGETQGVSWPLKWYLRAFPNARPYYTPDDSLLDASIIIADPQSFSRVDEITGSDYYQLNTLRMVWPEQDYFNLTFSRINDYLLDRGYRAAFWDIWLNRDHAIYSQISGKSGFSVNNWILSDHMRIYIRKTDAQVVWEYNLLESITRQDPYEQGSIQIDPVLVFGSSGPEGGQFDGPHGIAVAPDGHIYITDTNNHRVQEFSSEGEFLKAWGSFSGENNDSPSLGTFNLPWSLAISPDGNYIFVVDTWNHRIQKFTSDGNPVLAWGFPQYHVTLGDPNGLWGPRGIAVDPQGRVYVVDAGNKRVIIYDDDGNFLSQFGGPGSDPGQMNEPVGIAIDPQGLIYVTDTWNQRIQVFSAYAKGSPILPVREWEFSGWYGESLENKPMITVNEGGHVFVTDPELARVVEFTSEGVFVRAWGGLSEGVGKLGLVSAITIDEEGRILVTDAENNQVIKFLLP